MVLIIGNSIKSATSPAGKVERIIKNISVVSLDNETVLLEAEEAYANLDDYDKAKVDNAETLFQLRDDFDCMKAAYDSIEAIGTVTLDAETKINKARENFDACNEQSKELITNKAVLIAAEEKLSSLKVDNVIKAINGIGTVTFESKSVIEEAQKLYDNLTQAEKDKVSNIATLTKAKEAFDAVAKAEGAKKAKSAFAVLKSEYDKVQGITWYEPKERPYYADTRSYVLPYIGIQNGNAWLRLVYWYTADDWIFWENVIVIVDGVKYYDFFGSFGTVRDNEYGNIWEYADKEATDKDIEMLKAIADSKETIVRFQGDDYYDDITISASDKKAIKNVLTAYEYAEYLE